MAITLLLLWALMKASAGTPVGRFLNRALVEGPARFINRIERGHVLLTIALVAAIAGMVWLVGEEMTRLIATAAPEITTLLISIDAASLLDAALAAILVSGSVRLGSVRAKLSAVRRRIARPRATRSRPARREGAANDDEDGPRWAVAA
jgi:hypothetical protein